MKILLVLVLAIAGAFFIPDGQLPDFLLYHVPLPGDGEEGMDNLFLIVLLIKAVLRGFGAWLLLTLYPPPKK